MLAQGNPMMTKASKVMDIFYLDEQERKRYEAAWEYESDRLSMISESEQKGLERGKSLGSRQAKLEIAKTMLTMHYPFEDIYKISGLSPEEVRSISNL